MTPKVARGSSREGFSLIELLFAVVLLGAVLVTLAGLTYQTTRQAVRVTNGTGRQAYAMELVNRLVAMNFDSLVAISSACDTAAAGPDRYQRCYQVTRSGARRADVTVTVTPLRPGSYPQTFNFSRAAVVRSNPLFTP